MKKILFVTSEAYPLIKTGGLADVSGSLPIALKGLGHDVRILLPGYALAIAAGHFEQVKLLHGDGEIAILEGLLPDSPVPVWLLAHAQYFGRPGNPYLGPDGKPWSDNPERFSLLCHVAVETAMDRLGLRWKPDIVHCNDWQTGLVPALLSDEPGRPATVFTIHNLAYQGVFSYETFVRLRLPNRFWSCQALEFYNQLSFIKGGLVFADRINTVSPNYAEEIQSEEFGAGLEGLLRHRRERLSGILNGIDADAWNPATDPFIPTNYDIDSLEKRPANKTALQQAFKLARDDGITLMAWVGRLVQQKGIDLVIELLPKLMQMPIQLVIVGSGEARYEQILLHWARLYPDRISVKLGYDEAIAHLIEAGTDLFLMPSRFEPCGLNQMYSQRYGAVPIVRHVGGLADTVADANATNLSLGQATGVVFRDATADDLFQALNRGFVLCQNKVLCRKVQRAGMSKDFSWRQSAQRYLELYELAMADRLTADSLLQITAST
ncbi:glycogen synthase GlgA [Methylocaldum sp.]|uniref:glycogen synthase GlgA n=1 Tax=Methylocaldum sp. TaxID=1969727 RepID=UPI002D4C39FA|nr:glycogen synthase GlgA [Methylocaldum sp.]HYE36353.1 glycogen synthase GlgA [Methylocaldum sp.]